MLEILVLGELEVRRSGRVVALPASKKSRALLGYLVVTARTHLREALCDLLWPGPSDPRAALRWSLTKLRSLVDEGRAQRLVADREHVAFEAKDAEIDLAKARALVGADPHRATTDSLVRAASLCRGGLLEGLDLDDCYRYHEWCVAERESVRALRVEVLAALVQRLSDRPEEALIHARARVAIDPLAEAAHVEVIRILGQLGKRREALAQFETCRRILQIELGAQPSRALLHARSTLAPAIIDVSMNETEPIVISPSSGVIVGRREERDEIERRVGEVAAGRTQPMMLFTGESGIGKTRLLEAACHAMRAMGGTVVRARAFEAERIRPYGPWLEAISQLSALANEDLKTELAPLMAAEQPAATDQGRMFDAIARLFTRAASRAPLLVAVDDVQWFDDASTALLHALSRSLPTSTLIVAAARRAELGDNPPIQRLVHALLRERRLVERELAPLLRDETTELARALGATADAAERVFAESNGHPYFAVEIAQALARGDHVIAPSLAAMIDDRLGRLSPLARSVLPWAASMQRTFDVDLLTRVTNLSSSELLGAVTELEDHAVLVAKSSGYDFAHDLLRAAVVRKLSEPRRKLIHGQIARALVGVGASRANELAHHAALGGDHDAAARAALLAGKQALRVFANHEAAAVARFGIEHTTTLAPNVRLALHVELLEVIFTSRTWRGGKVELKAEAVRLVAECEAMGMSEEAARALHTVSSIEHVAETDADLAFTSSMRAASVSTATDPRVRAQRLSATAKCLTFLAREMGQARAMLDEAEVLALESGCQLLDLHWGRGLSLGFEGDAAGSRLSLSRTIDMARVANDPWAELECSLDLAMLELEEGSASRAEEIVVGLEPLYRKLDHGSERAKCEALLAVARLDRGGVPEALLKLRAADAKAMLAFCATKLALHDLAENRLESARALAEEAAAVSRAVRRRSDEVRARVVAARVDLARNHVDGALAELTLLLPDLPSISSRVRGEVVELARSLEIPTEVSTNAQTPRTHS